MCMSNDISSIPEWLATQPNRTVLYSDRLSSGVARTFFWVGNKIVERRGGILVGESSNVETYLRNQEPYIIAGIRKRMITK